MSTEIDDRVVEMRFDNLHFESNVQESISTLDKLKRSLNFNGASRAFSELESSANRVSLNGLTGAAEAVQVKFSHMQASVQYQLNRIVTKAVDTGRKVANALTIEPMKMGFQEYETQINAVQTILANTESKGTTLDDVNTALDELNKYADKTIYNFTEMTKNIGTFTAAGIDLDTSVTAIQGIANLAAVSGSTSQQASTAMYQLSQALSSGTVKLMDWNSVVNAGMGGQVFQDALKETARVHGIAIDKLIEKEGSFRETLKEGWLSSEILTETLEKFTLSTENMTEAEKAANVEKLKSKGYTDEQIEAIFKLGDTATNAATKVKTFTQLIDTTKEALQSGWTQSWELIIGDFEEAKKLYTEISITLGEMINKSAEERNNLLEGWNKAGGRIYIIESLRNTFEAVLSVITPIKEAFREIFPPITVKQLLSFSIGLKNITERMKLSGEVSDNIKRTFKGLFAIVDVGVKILSALFIALKPLVKALAWVGAGLLEATAYIGDWIVKFDDAIKKTDFFSKAVEGIIKFVKLFAKSVGEKFGFSGFEAFHALLERFQNRAAGVGGVVAGLGKVIGDVLKKLGESLKQSNFMDVLTTMWDGLQKLLSGIGTAIGALVDGFADVVSNSDFSGLTDLFNAISIGGIAAFIYKFVNMFSDGLEVFDSFGENVVGILTDVRGCFEAYQSSIKAGTLLTIASAIAILTGSLVVLSMIDSNKLMASIAAITALMGALMGSFKLFTMIGDNVGEMAKACGAMISMSVAILILSSALKNIAELKFGQMVTGVVGIASLAGVMVLVAEILGHSKKTIIKGAAQMIIFATAIKILASAVTDIAVLNWNELAKGLVGVGTLMGAVALFLSFTKFDKSTLSSAVAIVALAAGLKILASACADFATMKWDELARGLVGIGVVLAELVLFTRTTGNPANIITTAAALVIIGGAMRVFAYSCESFGSMNWETLGRGLAGMAGALAAVAISTRLMPADMISVGVGLVAVSGAMLVMAEVLNRMGNMEWITIGKGLTVLAGAMTIFAVALRAMTGTLSGSAAMLVATAAVLAFVPALSLIGAMKWSSIAKGLITIAAAFTILGIAGYVLAPVTSAIIGLASSITLIGTGILSAGAGLMYFGLGLSSIAAGLVLLSSSASAVMAAIKIIVVGTLDLIPSIISKFGEMVAAFFDAITLAAPSIGEAVKAVVLTVIDVLVECVPALSEGLYQMIVGVLDVMIQYEPQIIEKLSDLLIGIFDKLAEKMPEITQAGVDLMMAFFEGINQAIGNANTDVLAEGVKSTSLLAVMLANFAAMAYITPMAAAGILGVIGIIKMLDLLLNDLGIMDNVSTLEWLGGDGATLLKNVGTALGSFYGGIAGAFGSALSESLPKIGSDLSEFMDNVKPFLDGVRTVDMTTLAGAGILSSVIGIISIAGIGAGVAKIINLGGSLSDIASDLSDFMINLQPFIDGAKQVTPDIVNGVMSIASFITVLTGAGILEGIASFLNGDTSSIETFGSQLPALGTCINEFAKNLGTFDKAKVTTITCAADAITAMANAAQNLPNEGGWLADIVGDNAISTFGGYLPDLGKNLGEFAKNLGTFDDTKVTTVECAAKAIGALAEAANTIPNEGGWLAAIVGDNSISTFGGYLPDLGKNLGAFAQNLGTFDDAKVATVGCAADAIKAISDVAQQLPNEGGWLSAIVGDNSISTFGGYLPDLGTNLGEFAQNLGTFDDTKVSTVTCAANAIKSLAEVAQMLPNEGGWLAAIVGDNSISTFGSQLPGLGTNLGQFAQNLGTFTDGQVTTVDCAAKAIQALAAASQNIDGQTDWAKKLFGDNGLGVFSADMPVVGTNLGAFAQNLGTFTDAQVSTVECAASAISGMASAASGIDGQADWAKKLFGDNSLGSFSDQMPKVGSNLSSFAEKLGTFNEGQVSTVNSAVKALGAFAELADADLKGANKNLDGFGENMVEVATDISDFCENMPGSESVNAASDNLKTVTRAFKSIGDKESEAAKNFSKALGELGKNGISKFVEAFSSDTSLTSTSDAAAKLMSKAVEGMESKVKNLEKAGKEAASSAAEAIEGKYQSFYNAGSYLVDGFKNGISENSYKAEAKARAMVKAAKEAAEEALGIQSPSKEFYEVGDYSGQGFVNALGDFANKSYDAGYGLANYAKDGLNNALNKISDLIVRGIDAQPTIAPVVDLSNVKAGARNINDIFGRTISMRTAFAAEAVNYSVNRNIQNGSNNDVVDAIDKLGNKIGKGGDTYNFGDVRYNGDDEVANAVEVIVRAARQERRR